MLAEDFLLRSKIFIKIGNSWREILKGRKLNVNYFEVEIVYFLNLLFNSLNLIKKILQAPINIQSTSSSKYSQNRFVNNSKIKKFRLGSGKRFR